MVKGEAVMAIAIKPLRRRRRTTQRGKSMSQSQRWGKVVTTMPVPGGEITTTEILVPVDPNLDLNQALVEADAEEATEEYDLPELS
jgi:hypothetical protein